MNSRVSLSCSRCKCARSIDLNLLKSHFTVRGSVLSLAGPTAISSALLGVKKNKYRSAGDLHTMRYQSTNPVMRGRFEEAEIINIVEQTQLFESFRDWKTRLGVVWGHIPAAHISCCGTICTDLPCFEQSKA